jgi:stage III sporulation protein AG
MDVHKFLENIYKELKKIFSTEETNEAKKSRNKLPNLLIGCLSIILVCILVVLSTDMFKSTSTAQINNQSKLSQDNVSISSNPQDYEVAAENELKVLLENIDGVGRVKVMLTIDGSEEQIPAVNKNDSKSNTKEKDNTGGTRETTQDNNGSTIVITNDGTKSQPLIVKTNKPKILGVCVVADGAKEKYIQLEITQAVTRLFNITPEKVSVYPMKK